MTDSSPKPSPVEKFFASRRLTAGLLIVFLIELIGIVSYTYVEVERQIQPNHLADEAEKAIRKNYPEIRKEFTTEIKQNAPEIAAALSNKLIASTPEIRQWLQDAMRRQLRYGLDETTQLSAAEFSEFLHSNHDEIEELFVKLEETPDDLDNYVNKFEVKIQQQWGVDLEKQARNALLLHREFNDKLETINRGSALTPKELLEKRILRIVKTLEEKRLPDMPKLASAQVDR
ncbi:hypothetical protein GC197_13415 [bacterium]|nr:hypothetical protein [bacterium]